MAEETGAFGSLGGYIIVVMQLDGDKGRERLLSAADLAVIEGHLFEDHDDDLGEAPKILNGIAAEGDGIADLEGLDDAFEREVQRQTERSP